MHTDVVFFSSIRKVKLTAVFSQWVLVQLNSNMFVTYSYMERCHERYDYNYEGLGFHSRELTDAVCALEKAVLLLGQCQSKMYQTL